MDILEQNKKNLLKLHLFEVFSYHQFPQILSNETAILNIILTLLPNKSLFYVSAICAIAITIIACCVKRFMRKKREADLEKKESRGKNGVDLKVCIIKVCYISNQIWNIKLNSWRPKIGHKRRYMFQNVFWWIFSQENRNRNRIMK